MSDFTQFSNVPPLEPSEDYYVLDETVGDGEPEEQREDEGIHLISSQLDKTAIEPKPMTQLIPSQFLPILPGTGPERCHLSESPEAAFLVAFGLYHANKANRTIMRHYNFVSGARLGFGAQASVIRLEKNHTLQPYEEVQASLPRYIAYRRLKDIPEDENSSCAGALKDLAAEIILMRCLEERPHPNIAKIISVEWVGIIDTDWLGGLPAVLYEYSEHGSLTDFLMNSNLGGVSLDLSIKSKLCLDLGYGLQALHLLSISHGDVKLENALIFGNPVEGYTAKISDFGSISIQHCNRPRAWHGIWGAPEKFTPHGLKTNLTIAKAQDLYSLGLSIWSVYLNGCVPFYNQQVSNLIYQKFGNQNEYLDNVKSLKKNNDDWLLDIILITFEKDSSNSHAMKILEAIRSLCRVKAGARDIQKALKSLAADGIVSTFNCKPMTPEWSNQCFSAFSVQVRQLPVPSNPMETYFEIDAAVVRDTSPSPSWINLYHAISFLYTMKDSNTSTERIAQDMNHIIKFDERTACRRLFVSEAVIIRRACVAMIYLVSRYHFSPGVLDYGKEEVYHYIERGAAVEHRYNLDPELKSMLYRFRRTFRPLSPHDHPTTRIARRWLEETIHAHPKKFRKSFLLDDIKVNGEVKTYHYSAADDTSTSSGADSISCGASDYWEFGGRWAAFFNLEHIPLLQSLQKVQHDDAGIFNLLNELQQQGCDPRDMMLTASKDSLLHYAAGSSQLLLLKQLVENFKFALETKNICGETALMQACRLGMSEAVRYLLDRGASINTRRDDGYLPVQCVLTFPLESQREMLYSLTNKDPDLFFALVLEGYSGLEFPDFLLKPMSVFASAIYLKYTAFLDAVDELVNELFSSAPGAREGLWFRGLRMAASLHSPDMIRRYLGLLNHSMDGYLSFVVKDALEVEVLDRILYHGARYREALNESLELLLGHVTVLDNSAECQFYHTALIKGHFDILPFLWRQSELLKHRGLRLSTAFCPRRASAATFMAAGQFTLAERAIQLFHQRLQDFPNTVDYIDVNPIDLRHYPEVAYLLLCSPISSPQKFEVLDKLFDQGWEPDAGSCLQVLSILVRSSGTNYSMESGGRIESLGDWNAQKRRIAIRMLEPRRNDQVHLLKLFEFISHSAAHLLKLTLFLEAASEIRTDLNVLFDSYTANQYKHDTIFHTLAESNRSPTKTNSWGTRKLTSLHGRYFSDPHHLLLANNLDVNALSLGIMLSNYEFVEPFIEIIKRLGPKMPSSQEISRHRFLLEYTEIERWRAIYNQNLSFHKTDEEIVLDYVGGDNIDIKRTRTEYLQLYRQLRSLAQEQARHAGITVRDYRTETQEFIDALVNLDMDQVLSLQIIGFHIWEIPNYEPTMARLVNQFNYLSVLLQIMEALLQLPGHGDMFPVMASFARILDGDFVGTEAALAEELGPSAFIAMLYVLGGTNLVIDSTSSTSNPHESSFEFKDLSAARMNMGQLHNLFRHDFIDLKLPFPPKFPSYPLVFNGRVGILSELLRRYEPIVKDELTVFPSGISPEASNFRDEIWREMNLYLKHSQLVEQDINRGEQTATRLQNLIAKILASFSTCNFRILMTPGTVEAKYWSVRVMLVCCLRCFQFVESQTKISATEESTLRMRERCSRRAKQRLDVIDGKSDHFIYQIFKATHSDTQRRMHLSFYETLLMPPYLHYPDEFRYQQLVMENKQEEAMAVAQELLEIDHMTYMNLWNDQFPEKWKAEFESISHGLMQLEENRRRLLLGAAYCWYATENPKYEFLGSRLNRSDGRAIPIHIKALKESVARCYPETDFEKQILSEDWNKSKWKRKRYLKYHWEDLWPLTERRENEIRERMKS